MRRAMREKLAAFRKRARKCTFGIGLSKRRNLSNAIGKTWAVHEAPVTPSRAECA